MKKIDVNVKKIDVNVKKIDDNVKKIDDNVKKTSDAQKRAYKKWVEKNKKRRNEIALKSYHKVKVLKNKSEEVA